MTGVDRAGVAVAIIGAGPAGIYTAAGLLSKVPEARIDVIDREASPYGLVRYGVAPDHHKIKSVTRVLSRTLSDPRVRYFGQVSVGELGEGADVSLDELRQRYHAVVVATGAPHPKRLQVPGADLVGSCTAGELVAWYNGKAEAQRPAIDHAETVVLIGSGNVSLDVARVLLKSGDGLQDTDVPLGRLAALDELGVRRVNLVVRCSPAQVKFSLAELRGLEALQGVDIVAHLPEQRAHDSHSAPADEPEPVVALFEQWARKPPSGARKQLHLHFELELVQLHGQSQVESAEFQPQQSNRDPVLFPTDLVVAAIGFQGEPLSGSPFDQATATIAHRDGRVARGLYVVGWAGRGAQGVIGTNKLDAVQTVARITADLDDRESPLGPPTSPDDDLADLLSRRSVSVKTWQDWLALDAQEIELGQQHGRDRIKVVSHDGKPLKENRHVGPDRSHHLQRLDPAGVYRSAERRDARHATALTRVRVG